MAQEGIKENEKDLSKKDFLKGLTKAGEGDLNPETPIMFDGVSIPVYSENGDKIEGMKLMELMMKGIYMPEPYINDKKEIKAFVLRKATEEEKIQMQQMQKAAQGESELIGTPAKTFSVINMDGRTISLEDLKGKVIVMNFWFVECKPCIMEMPELNEIVEDYKNEEVIFLGFATNKKSKIEKFLETKKFDYNIIPDSRKIAMDYGVQSYPTHIIIDREGMIRFVTSGLGPTTINDIRSGITEALSDNN